MSDGFQPSDFEGLTLGKKLGAGSFGTVYVGLLTSGRYVAVKQLGIEAGSDPHEINLEVEVHRRLNHANIIRYLHSKVDMVSDPANPKLLVFLEYVTGGSLTAIMKTLPGGSLPVPVIKVYARHMFQGLHYLHENGVAHRDIKGENVLISQDQGVAKLADFDQAKVVVGTLRTGAAGPAKTLAGTPYWIAPEVLTQEEGYDPMKADIWSAGCTVGEMFTGKAPWVPMSNPMGIMYKLANSKGWPDALPRAEMPADLQDFLDCCFHRDPTERADCDALLAHSFLKA